MKPRIAIIGAALIGLMALETIARETSADIIIIDHEKEYQEMLKLDYSITIGNYELLGVEKVTVETSQDFLSDICMISVPGMVRGVALQIEDKVKRGDPVTVRLGYNGSLQTEFTGYLKGIFPESPMRLECEDSVYLLRRAVKPKILKNAGVKSIAQYVLDQVNPQLSVPFKLVTDISPDSFKFDSFPIQNATGFEVLDKLRTETGLMVCARSNELHVHLAYTQKTGEVTYDFERNIEDTKDLNYVRSQDAKVKVKVIGRTAKGAKISGEAGEDGGDVRTIQRPTISDRATLENIAKETLKKITYDGYRGAIVAWLYPFCSTGHSAKILDRDYPEREGKYYVTGTKVEFSKNGGIRTSELGFKLS
jgi:hypothetical protein